MNIKSDNFLIVLLSFFTLLASGVLAYVLYTHYPSVPVFGAREEGYAVFLTADKLTDKHMPLQVWRDGMLVKKITDVSDFSLEHLPPGTYTYTISYTAQNMLGMNQHREGQASLVVASIPNKELAQYFDFPKVRFSNKGYAVYVSAPDLKGYSELDVFEGGKLLQNISKDTATPDIFLGYFSPGAHAFHVSFTSGTVATKSLNGILRQNYEIEVGTIAAFREEGYKVLVTIQNLNGITSPVVVSRDGKRVRSFQKEGEYVLEYAGPGEYTYDIGYTIRDASGEDKKLEVTKHLSVSEYPREELGGYYVFPKIEFIVKNYGVYAASSNIETFSKITLYENGERINTFTLNSSGQTFIGNLPLGTHNLEVAFVSEETRKIENLLRKEYEVEVAPIPPSIASLSLSHFLLGQTTYASDATAAVSNAATCTAKLLEQSIIGDTSLQPHILKSYSFRAGEGFDYFSPRTESWSWKDISLSSNIEHKEAVLRVDVTCYDYYQATSTKFTQQIPTDNIVFPDALALTYAYNNTSSTTEGIAQNNANTAFNCELLINDNTSTVLDKKIFQLSTQGTYTFDIGKYNKNQLSTTVTCTDSVGNNVVKTSLYNKQSQLSLSEGKEQEKSVLNKNLTAVYYAYKILLKIFFGESGVEG